MLNSAGRILAIDFGNVRTGVAKSDPEGIIATPLPFIPTHPRKDAQAVIRKLIAEFQIEKIVVGLPLKLSGEDSPQTEKCRRFALELKQITGLPVEMWDERMTTQLVERMLIAADVRREKRKQAIDSLCAQQILQSYLDAVNQFDEDT